MVPLPYTKYHLNNIFWGNKYLAKILLRLEFSETHIDLAASKIGGKLNNLVIYISGTQPFSNCGPVQRFTVLQRTSSKIIEGDHWFIWHFGQLYSKNFEYKIYHISKNNNRKNRENCFLTGFSTLRAFYSNMASLHIVD